ncbi:peptidase S51 dipeptidase E [Pseudopedobacter saltans DSM 12145]|uniref:Cyanophycinase n=1 Tax=Pseudopedobacter saltans (strain ATCC 51119 / DSM 12145 / JCM 21818 / CCUG 39354 / LMG 10337 / NBRC 100064 / NCIMB 13643) TaxID=762903 RepID=F0S9Z8_PSESL|nr:cyanophycinase [Pseudopedobacter saltans]ADY52556.1 peptidase S51 dipeptidase E [Pseudopedobacter saltans DSM 12145]
MRRNILTLLLGVMVQVALAQTPIKINEQSITRHGPEKGSLIIIGGGGSTPAIWKRFLELAGGKERANIVVITAAVGDSAAYNTRTAERIKKELGISKVSILHTNNLAEANSEKFIEPLKNATGVFFDGGRQWRIADSYLNTLTHQAFWDVLNRGGVIIGSSAGASIQGSFLWRGDTKGPHILIGDHTQGLGFLKNSAIDQHLLKRNRQFDLVDFIEKSPDLIGIGLDEATSIVVQRDTLEVVGKSYAVIYDYNTIVNSDNKEAPNKSSSPFIFLSEGQKYDLKNRSLIHEGKKRSNPTLSNK